MYNTEVDRKKTSTDKKRGKEMTFLKASKASVMKATKLFKKNEQVNVLGVAPREFKPGSQPRAGKRYLVGAGERQEWIDEKNLEAVK